jgi:hypothetical protein
VLFVRVAKGAVAGAATRRTDWVERQITKMDRLCASTNRVPARRAGEHRH